MYRTETSKASPKGDLLKQPLHKGLLAGLLLSFAAFASAQTTVKNTVTITVPAGVVNSAPAASQAASDEDTVTNAVSLTASFSGLPAALVPGLTYPNLTLTCTNGTAGDPALSPALGVACAPSITSGGGTISALACVPAASPLTLAPGASVACTFSYQAANTALPGDNLPAQQVVLGGTATATNPGAVSGTTSATLNILDAVNDSASAAFGTGASVNVLTNDTLGTAAASLSGPANVSLTQVGVIGGPSGFVPSSVSFNVATGSFSVTAAAISGTYTVSYKICAPVGSATNCEAAIASIVVTSGTDMTASFTGLPAIAAPGSTVSGSIVCTAAVAAATAPTCTAAASTAPGLTGATVSVGGPCIFVNGSAATLNVGGTMTCPVSVTLPVNPANSNVPEQVVGIVATAGASNEAVADQANNTAQASVGIIDALNDSASAVFSTTVPVTLAVLTNDTVGSNPAVAGAAGNVTVTATTALPAGFSFSAAGTYTVPAGTVNGTYTVGYQVCTKVAPIVCDSAQATVTISAASANITVTKTNTPAFGPSDQAGDLVASGSIAVYKIVVSNAAGSAPVTNLLLQDLPSDGVAPNTVKLTLQSVACATASPTNQCATPPSVAQLLAGYAIPETIAAGQTYEVLVTAQVQ